MDPQLLPLAISAAAVALTLIVVGTVMRRKGRRIAEHLTPAFELGTAQPLGFFGVGLRGLHRGYQCRYVLRFASQHDRGGATLGIEAVAPFSWSAERSQAGTRLLLSLRVLRNLEVGDPALDERFRFAAEDPGALQAVLRIEAFRRAVLALVATENFESIRARANRIELSWAPRSANLDEDPETLRLRLDAAVGLLTAGGWPPRLRAPS